MVLAGQLQAAHQILVFRLQLLQGLMLVDSSVVPFGIISQRADYSTAEYRGDPQQAPGKAVFADLSVVGGNDDKGYALLGHIFSYFS